MNVTDLSPARFLLACVVACCCASRVAADWPTYRGDSARSGYTSQALPAKLHLQWSFKSPHLPQPAWPRSDRLTFDRAIQPVVAGGVAYWGDSVTGAVTAVDLASGRQLWSVFTEGPVRFAPSVWQDRLFVVSDDGCLYALACRDGELLWKRQAGPDHSRRLGNERMISRWPARGGPVVVDDTVYFAAGIWPTEGIYLSALDASTGEVRWRNDDSGSIDMPQPHGGANAESGVSAQGYLVAADGAAASADGGKARPWLLVPTGRAVPAAFDRATGAFQYFHLQRYGQKGGAAVMASGELFFNSGIAFDLATGAAIHTVGPGPQAATPQGLVRAAEGRVTGYRWIEVETKDRRGKVVQAPGLEALWSVPQIPAATELVVAGSRAIVGADGRVLLVDIQQGEVVWSAEVEGVVGGLAVSDGKLLVSTDQGRIYCFANDPAERPAQIASHDDPADNSAMAAVAKDILKKSGVTEGYCLDLGCGDGELSGQLAQQSKLQIIAIDSDAKLVAIARRRLADAGLLGSRVTVLTCDDLNDTGLPNYFADLIVSRQSLAGGAAGLPTAEVERTLRPYGGISLLGHADALQRVQRGALPGAGEWTHQYSSAGNSTCSADERLKGTLGMLWFRDVDLEMPQRHGRGPGPLFYDGRLYSEGLHELACVNAYNGRLLWKYPLPDILKAYNGDELMGTAGTHSNYCVVESGVYVRQGDHCLRIDRQDGTLLGKLPAPKQADGKPGRWGYIACDGEQLFGSLSDPEHVVTYRYVNRGGDMSSQLTESKTLFCLDANSGELRWRYDAEHSIRHNAIAVGKDTIYLIDRPLARFDRTKEAKSGSQPPGSLLALDVASGEVRWRSDEQIDGTLLALSADSATLLMAFQPTRFALASERGGRLVAFDSKDGSQRWSREADYASRPMINDRTIYAQGGAWDLLTGDPRSFEFSRSYGCGILAGSRHMMVFRSATLGYFDLTQNNRTKNFGGVRPGCWINAIPAGGLVLVPDASAGCVCSYLNQSWFALEPDAHQSPALERPSIKAGG